ncbi:hypothetical protein TR2A62_3540 [Thalassobium sp. R2A62]|nr:hypothetical protein TR2A62_3540 [Thalassobium sp. R2A62]
MVIPWALGCFTLPTKQRLDRLTLDHHGEKGAMSPASPIGPDQID